MKPRCLDLFCSAGGATRGLQLAGFHVTGVDIKPQPRYVGDAFHQTDAMTFPLDGYDFIWASPPCQAFSIASNMLRERRDHPNLIDDTRRWLVSADVPYVIENVPGAPLGKSLLLCGSMFGLLVRRHRYFECSRLVLAPGPCRHGEQRGDYPAGRARKSGRINKSSVVMCYGGGGSRGSVALWSRALGIDWMIQPELGQSIPPAYSRYIGEQMLPHVLRRMKEVA